ncbi:MAG: putative DNA binding domain-containing protein [Anaerolineae bacterium]|nr:putative DNA binding domain-containing protein [Anaerolineae bacterium]
MTHRKRNMQWRRVDLHVHTPASVCYQQPEATFLDILLRAEARGLDVIAITDHNTVAGYAAMRREIEQLLFLERLERLRPAEKEQLEQYRRLSEKLLVLPGFEFTALLGFHILGIFSERTTVRELEHILLDLRIPPDKLDLGSSEMGATVDVQQAYRTISAAGGLAIAAHANSTHGVAMQDFDFGGQTKISYTQDPHLAALEVTDLESRRRRSTATFFNGSKPEYPRHMHCIQGSDAHRLTRDPDDPTNLGVGDRSTEMLLPEVSFEAIKATLFGSDFARTRPSRPATMPFDHVRAAREQGANIVQSFHESIERRGGRIVAILRDIVAFANTNGGTIYVGVSTNPRTPAFGVERPEETVADLRAEIGRRITPPIEVSVDVLQSEGKPVVRIVVPRGDSMPYALEGSRIFVRQESETNLAMRDEIVQLVRRAAEAAPRPVPAGEPAEPAPATAALPLPTPNGVEPPRTGVEVVQTEERKGVLYHTMRDLRNGNQVHNVTRSSARRLWQYAISRKEKHEPQESDITWTGSLGLLRKYQQGRRVRYDLVQRLADGSLRVYYGVTDEGIHGPWKSVVGSE